MLQLVKYYNELSECKRRGKIEEMGSCFQQGYLHLQHKSNNGQDLQHVLACAVELFGFFPSLCISDICPTPDGRYVPSRICLLHGVNCCANPQLNAFEMDGPEVRLGSWKAALELVEAGSALG